MEKQCILKNEETYMRYSIFLIFLSSFFHCLSQRYIYIDKNNLRLHVIEESDTIISFPICVGKNFGQKIKPGDHKTPEGKFTISMIQNSSTWRHDFKDGKGLRRDAYGPWFFRLKTPMSTHIGIHGTCFPESIGKRESEGCIRLNNEDLIKLYNYVYIGMNVFIQKDSIK